jgi:hypothetical protein
MTGGRYIQLAKSKKQGQAMVLHFIECWIQGEIVPCLGAFVLNLDKICHGLGTFLQGEHFEQVILYILFLEGGRK